MMLGLVPVIISLFALTRCQPAPTETYRHDVVLDSFKPLHLYWNFNDTDITFEIHGNTTGWVGIGFSADGSMTNADIIAGWVKADGSAVVTDRHGPTTGNSYPPTDTVQDVELLEGFEMDGWTVIKFRRLLITGDAEDHDLAAGTMNVIYAFYDSDPTGDDLASSDYHGFNRGTHAMYLLGPDTTEPFNHNAILDSGEVLHLYWNFDETSITFELHGETTGWVGIGFSPSGSMVDADIIVGWVKSGNTVVTDRHGQSTNTYPPLDAEQNVELLEGFEMDGWTVIKFRRLLVTCDSEDRDITTDTMKVIFAWGGNDPDGDDLAGADYHGPNRGVKSILLLQPTRSDEDMFPEGETHLTFDLLADRFAMPAVDTYYNCRLLKLPDLPSKHHMVKFEPVVQQGNELIVHHILVYHCNNAVNITMDGTDQECYQNNMPPDFQSCDFPIAAWAIGGGAFHFPKHAGFPLGTPDAPKYVVLETHYDNPAVRSDIVDSSGLRFTYTPDLRDNDAGVIEAGHTVNGFQHVIPPNSESFLNYGDCSSNCLHAHMELEKQDSLNVFAVLLHSHLLGRELYLRHIRNGTELPYLAKDASYDFNFQETRHLASERTIMKGDSLQMVCNSNSQDRTDLTMGGLSTAQEMCLSYVYYYPKIKLTFCETGPDLAEVAAYFGITQIEYIDTGVSVPDLKNFLIVEPPEYAGKTMYEVVSSQTWNDETGDAFSLAMKSMIRSQYCYSTGEFPPGVTYGVDPPNIEFPYVEGGSNCTGSTPKPSDSTTGAGTPETTTGAGTPETSTGVGMPDTTSGVANSTPFLALVLVCSALVMKSAL